MTKLSAQLHPTCPDTIPSNWLYPATYPLYQDENEKSLLPIFRGVDLSDHTGTFDVAVVIKLLQTFYKIIK